jgi:polyphenol oxidase
VLEHTTPEGITWFQFASLAACDGLVTHGIFSRLGGVSAPPFASLNCATIVQDDPEAVAENRRRVAAVLPNLQLITTRPIHGSNVVEVLPETPGIAQPYMRVLDARADIMITRQRGLGLTWAYADCTPVLLVDPVHEAIALAHAGWRGTSQAVAVVAIEAMHASYGTRPSDVIAALGPAIGPCCYEVDEPVHAAFTAHPLASQHMFFSTLSITNQDGTSRESLRVDVLAANRSQLIAAGVRADHIEMSGFCTGCSTDLFFSHRVENGRTGRFAVVLGLR